MHEFNGRRFDEAAAFLAVAERGSFARAAEALGRDASLVSRRVSALEQRLGVRLLERTTRKLRLTEAGVRLNERLAAAAAAILEAEQEAGDAGSVPRGLLRLSLPGAFGRMWIAPLLVEFLAEQPAIRIEASYGERHADLVEEGFDAAIRVAELPDSTLVARRLASNQRLLCAAPAYLQRHGTPSTPEQLAGHACLGFSRLASHPNWPLRKGDELRSVRVDAPLTADDNSTLVGAAVRGLGIMLAAEWLVGPELASGTLVPVLEDWALDGRGAIYLVRPSSRHAAGKTRAFSDWIAARLSTPPWQCAPG